MDGGKVDSGKKLTHKSTSAAPGKYYHLPPPSSHAACTEYCTITECTSPGLLYPANPAFFYNINFLFSFHFTFYCAALFVPFFPSQPAALCYAWCACCCVSMTEFIFGHQMSESVRASVHCQNHLLPERLQTGECVRIVFPILEPSVSRVRLLFLGVQSTVVGYVSP